MICCIGYEQGLSLEQVKKSLLELFPEYIIFEDDPETIYPRNINWNRLDHVWIQVDRYEGRKDFQYGITIESGAKKEYDQKQALHIARKLSEEYSMRTITEYVNPELDEDPYGLCIVFDQGKSYLADDTWDSPMIGDEEEEIEAIGVKILKEFDIPRYLFDSTGDCIGTLPD